MNNVNMEKLSYLLDYLEDCMASAVCDVLQDSGEDPQFSAVTVSNLIKCYMDIKHSIGQQTCFTSVEEYLQYNCFTTAEIQAFEEKRAREESYYMGKQFCNQFMFLLIRGGRTIERSCCSAAIVIQRCDPVIS